MAETAGGGSRLHRVRVTIAGDEYTLRTDEPFKLVEKLAAKVDRDLRELADRFPGVSRERLAVLLALRLTAQLERAREQARAARKGTQPAAPAGAAEPGETAEPGQAGAPVETGHGEEAATTGSSLFDSPQGASTL